MVSLCSPLSDSCADRARLRLAREPFMGRFKPQTEEMSLGFWRIRRWRIVAASPAKKARALVDPIVVSDHVVDAREVKADQAEAQTDRVIDEIVMQRQELAFEQGGVKEAHGKAQKKHVEREMPPRSPGGGDRPPGEPGGAAAHDDAYQEKDAERVPVGEKFRDRDLHQCLPPSR